MPIFAGDRESLFAELERWLGRAEPSLLVTPNVDQIINLTMDHSFAESYQHARLAIADGMPVVALAHRLGYRGVRRITGAELLLWIAHYASHAGRKIAIAGGKPGVSTRAAANLRSETGADVRAIDFPLLHGADDPASEAAIAQLRDVGADYVFLCLGSPKQEVWFAHWQEALPSGVYIGAGAAVDFAAEDVRRAPAALQTMYLEWAWRLVQEPRRLAYRYLIKSPRFLPIASRALRESRKRVWEST